jgi:ferritin-like metal-binding protein YciE
MLDAFKGGVVAHFFKQVRDFGCIALWHERQTLEPANRRQARSLWNGGQLRNRGPCKEIQTMDDLLLHGLQDIYYAENQIVKALPKLIDKATNRDLNKGLKDHLEETKKQIERLDQAFKKLGKQPQGVKCPAIDGLMEEGDEIAGEVADKDVLDAAIVGAAQAVEHYEIARYWTLIAWAESLGHDDSALPQHQPQ